MTDVAAVSMSTLASDGAAFARLDAVAAREFPRVRRDGMAFLNNASTGPLPESALRALADFNAKRAEPWTITQEFQFGTVARSRELIARLIGATPSEIALMTNTSYGLNFAARSLPLAAGDVVLTSDREFPSNIYPWMALEQARGVHFKRIPCVGRLADEAAILRAIEETPKLQVVVLSWVSFETGYTLDLARIGAACRDRGIFFVVDAIQGVGALTIDVASLPIDILACGCQKWLLSPWGAGFVYVRPDLVQRLEPCDVSWMAVRDSDDFTRMLEYDFTYRDDARRFEVITLPFQDFAGMNAALDLFHEVGPATAAARLAAHVGRIFDWASTRPEMQVVSSPEPARRSGIVAVIPPLPAQASEVLWKAGVAHSLREGAIRLSPHWYTPASHIEYALGVLEGAGR